MQESRHWRWLASPVTAVCGMVMAVLVVVGGISAAAQRGPTADQADREPTIAVPIAPDASSQASSLKAMDDALTSENSAPSLPSTSTPAHVSTVPDDSIAGDDVRVDPFQVVPVAHRSAPPVFLDPKHLKPEVIETTSSHPAATLVTSSTSSATPSSHHAPAATTAPVTSSKPAQSSKPAKAPKPAKSTAPAATTAPAKSTAPAKNSASTKNTAPAKNSAPTATTAPAKSTAPTKSSKPSTAQGDNADSSGTTSPAPTSNTATTTAPSTPKPSSTTKAPPPPACDPFAAPTITWKGSKAFFYDYSCGVNWDAMAYCEASNIPTMLNKTGKYMGMFQFDEPTWLSVGGSKEDGKLPHQVGPAEQLMRAKKLYQMRDLKPWACGYAGAYPADWVVPGRP